jgi:nucleoside-diphosphate-sugar epimerase
MTTEAKETVMSRHLVVGAGPVGRAVARHLIARGDRAVHASRSGAGLPVAGADRLAVDATSPDALAAAAEGADVVYNCLNPSGYHLWAKEWPPLHAALTAAAERSGAVLATVGNLYPLGRPAGVMTESTPERPREWKGELRASMTADVMAAHRAGRLRAVEVRASDFIGAGVGQNGHSTRNLERIRAGRSAQVVGATDVPHAWTFIDDVAAAVVAAASDEDLLGRIHLVPTNPARTQREVATDLGSAVGRPHVRVTSTPDWLLAVVGWFSPAMREVRSLDFQFTAPYEMDTTVSEKALGLAPTPWAEIIRRTVLPEASEQPAGPDARV